MNKIRICLAGATGWIGTAISKEILQSEDLELVGAVSRSHRGKPLGELIREPDLVTRISGSVSEALQTPTDVLLDYTHAEAVKSHVMTALHKGVHVVIGSSGLTEVDFQEIDELATSKQVGVIACGNFAMSAVLLKRFATEAARFLSHWEIIDYASATKPDSPSGMSRELAHTLSLIRKPEIAYPVEKTVGLKESRGAMLAGSQIHSVRLPGYVIGVEIIFGEPDERLTLRYDAGSGPQPYIRGTLLAIRKVRENVGLVRGLDKIMIWP